MASSLFKENSASRNYLGASRISVSLWRQFLALTCIINTQDNFFPTGMADTKRSLFLACAFNSYSVAEICKSAFVPKQLVRYSSNECILLFLTDPFGRAKMIRFMHRYRPRRRKRRHYQAYKPREIDSERRALRGASRFLLSACGAYQKRQSVSGNRVGCYHSNSRHVLTFVSIAMPPSFPIRLVNLKKSRLTRLRWDGKRTRRRRCDRPEKDLWMKDERRKKNAREAGQ